MQSILSIINVNLSQRSATHKVRVLHKVQPMESNSDPLHILSALIVQQITAIITDRGMRSRNKSMDGILQSDA